MAQDADRSKDAALRAVGRTLVNFQRLEHNVKLAAKLGPLNGTIQKIERDIARRHERAGLLSLGQAIQAWLEICNGVPATFEGTPDLFDITFQTTFTMEVDDESHARNAKALTDLLKTRNDFVHSRFALYPWDSPQACEDLVVELDGINSAIAVQVQYFSSLLLVLAELRKVHTDSLESTSVEAGARDA